MTRVLIVDDKPENLYLLRVLLQGHGCEVEEARHGAEALVRARQTAPQLVISDLLMPVMDGYMLLRQWKADARLKSIPFIVYTATYTEPGDERLALDLGADAFILKPAEPEPFMARIREVLAKKERGKLPPARAPRSAEQEVLEEYSAVLVRKLEEKALQLEQANRALREQAQLLSHSQRVAHIGGWFWDGINAIKWTDETYRIYGVSPETFKPSVESLIELIHPEDRPAMQRWMAACVAGEKPGELEFRALAPDGAVRVLSGHGELIHDAANPADLVTGTVQDITERKKVEAALRESDERLRLAVESGGVGLWEWQVATGQLTWNDRLKAIFGLPPDATGLTLDKFLASIHPQDRAEAERGFRAALAAHAQFNHEYRIVQPGGGVRWIVAIAQGSYDAAGQPLRMLGVGLDITARKLTEAALQESEQKLSLFVVNTPAAIAMFDRDMRYLAYSRRWRADYGLGEQELAGRSHYEVFPDLPERWKEVHRRCLAGAVERAEEDPFARADGTVDWVRWEARPWHAHAGGIGGIIIFSEVITERRRAEDALRESRARLQALARRLLEVQEAERRAISRELHDEVGGVLTAVKLNLQSLRRQGARAPGEAALADSIGLVDGAIQSVRALSLELRPALLDDLGLIPALKWYCERQSMRAGIPIELELDAIDLKSAPQLESACFRIVQESITNALRHAGASRIEVSLHRGDGSLVIEIADDGAGFDAAAARARARAGQSSGLAGMQERAQLLDGRLDIDSAPGAGTRVRAEFALPEDA